MADIALNIDITKTIPLAIGISTISNAINLNPIRLSLTVASGGAGGTVVSVGVSSPLSTALTFTTPFTTPNLTIQNASLPASQFLRGDGTWAIPIGGGGTVTSIGLTVPAEFTVTPSTPITTAGTFAITKASQSANFVYVAPNGAAGVPTFRALLGQDIAGGAATVAPLPSTNPAAIGVSNQYARQDHVHLLALTTTGSSGASTYSNGVLNVPQYSGGSGTLNYDPTVSTFTAAGTTTSAGGTGATTFTTLAIFGLNQRIAFRNVFNAQIYTVTGSSAGSVVFTPGLLAADVFNSGATIYLIAGTLTQVAITDIAVGVGLSGITRNGQLTLSSSGSGTTWPDTSLISVGDIVFAAANIDVIPGATGVFTGAEGFGGPIITNRQLPTTQRWLNNNSAYATIRFANNRWFMGSNTISDTGTSIDNGNFLSVSTDNGVSFTKIPSPSGLGANVPMSDINYLNGTYVLLVGSTAFPSANYYTSTDLVNWTPRAGGFAGRVEVFNGRFRAQGGFSSGAGTARGLLSYSSSSSADGVAFTSGTFTGFGTFTSAISMARVRNNQIVVVATDNTQQPSQSRVFVSSDGLAFTTFGNSFNSPAGGGADTVAEIDFGQINATQTGYLIKYVSQSATACVFRTVTATAVATFAVPFRTPAFDTLTFSYESTITWVNGNWILTYDDSNNIAAASVFENQLWRKDNLVITLAGWTPFSLPPVNYVGTYYRPSAFAFYDNGVLLLAGNNIDYYRVPNLNALYVYSSVAANVFQAPLGSYRCLGGSASLSLSDAFWVRTL